MENDTQPPQKKSPWFWIFLIVSVLAISQCAMEDTRAKRQSEAELKTWQDSPEAAFRFCITTVAGASGTASPAQIEACRPITKESK